MERFLKTLAFSVILTCTAATAARAEDANGWRSPLSNDQLAGIRAGFLSADGVTFEFGVSLQTFIGGQLVLQSNLTVGDPATVSSSALTSGTSTAAPNHVASLSFTLPTGSTALTQQIGANGIQNIIATSASNQQITQNTNLTLQLAGFQQNQVQYLSQRLVSTLSSQLNFALSSGGH